VAAKRDAERRARDDDEKNKCFMREPYNVNTELDNAGTRIYAVDMNFLCATWLGVVICWVGCSSPKPTSTSSTPPVVAAPPETRTGSGAALTNFADIAQTLAAAQPSWTQITVNPLPKIELCAAASGRHALLPSTHREKEFFHTYMPSESPVAIEKYRAGELLPNQASLIKRSFTEDGKTTAFFVMQKQAGANPAGGDWLYATVGVDGKTIRSGVLADCGGCHNKQAANDYLFRTGLSSL
jgi:Cytochrome P460